MHGKEEFFRQFSEVIESDIKKLPPGSYLADINWDSLSAISFISLADDLMNKSINSIDLSNCKTVGDLLALID